jgi:hypothetical protein
MRNYSSNFWRLELSRADVHSQGLAKVRPGASTAQTPSKYVFPLVLVTNLQKHKALRGDLPPRQVPEEDIQLNVRPFCSVAAQHKPRSCRCSEVSDLDPISSSHTFPGMIRIARALSSRRYCVPTVVL